MADENAFFTLRIVHAANSPALSGARRGHRSTFSTHQFWKFREPMAPRSAMFFAGEEVAWMPKDWMPEEMA